MEQKKIILAGRDLHAGDVVRFNGELHRIGTIGHTDAFDEDTMTIVHLAEAEPVKLSDTEALKTLGAKASFGTLTIKGDKVSVHINVMESGEAIVLINTDKGQRREQLSAKNACLHVVQQLAWKHGRGELKLRVPKPKKQNKDEGTKD
jgi:hypothetical protein